MVCSTTIASSHTAVGHRPGRGSSPRHHAVLPRAAVLPTASSTGELLRGGSLASHLPSRSIACLPDRALTSER